MPEAGGDELQLPIAQFDILLPGLGLEDRWRLQAQQQRAQAIRIHNIGSTLPQKGQEQSRVHLDTDDIFETDEQSARETSISYPDKQPGSRTTVSRNVAVSSTPENGVRLLKHASWERVGLHTTRAPAYSAVNKIASPLPSPISPCSADGLEWHESALPRPRVGDGCFIDIGLSLVSPRDTPSDVGPANGLPQRQVGDGASSPMRSATPKKTKADKALGFFFEFADPITD